MSSIQTRGANENLEFLANLTATLLQSRRTWEKNQFRNFEEAARESSTRWPKCEKQMLSELSFLIKTSESPSTTTSYSPSSMANVIALRQARASTSSTEGGRGIFSDKAPITKPCESLMTTPIPALEQS